MSVSIIGKPLAADLTVAPELGPGAPWDRMVVLYADVADAVAAEVAADRVPIVLSGHCTTSLGVVAGLQRVGVEPGIVWFDAHGDVQTPETSTSGYLGGMPLRQLVGGADRVAPDWLGLRPLPEAGVALVDARDLDPPEAEFLAGAAIRRLPVESVSGDSLPPGVLYVHVDVDVVDPREMPGLLFPAADGPSLAAVVSSVRSVLASGRVAAVALACTWRPGGGGNRVVAHAFHGPAALDHQLRRARWTGAPFDPSSRVPRVCSISTFHSPTDLGLELLSAAGRAVVALERDTRERLGERDYDRLARLLDRLEVIVHAE
jgi:arginase